MKAWKDLGWRGEAVVDVDMIVSPFGPRVGDLADTGEFTTVSGGCKKNLDFVWCHFPSERGRPAGPCATPWRRCGYFS